MRSFRAVALAFFISVVVIGATSRAVRADELIPGRIVLIKNADRAKFVARPPTGTYFSPADAGGQPTDGGGMLSIFDDDPFRPVSATFALPAGGWAGLGNPAGIKGFKYRGAGSPSDPCKIALIKRNVIKAVCVGTGITLPTPFTGQVGIILAVGTDPKQYCAIFGGDEVRNDATVLKRKNALAPGACPLDLNSSTTIPPTTSTSTTSSTTTTDSVPAPSTSSTSVTTTFTGTITTTSTTLPDCGDAIAPTCSGTCPLGTCTFNGINCNCQ